MSEYHSPPPPAPPTPSRPFAESNCPKACPKSKPKSSQNEYLGTEEDYRRACDAIVEKHAREAERGDDAYDAAKLNLEAPPP